MSYRILQQVHTVETEMILQSGDILHQAVATVTPLIGWDCAGATFINGKLIEWPGEEDQEEVA